MNDQISNYKSLLVLYKVSCEIDSSKINVSVLHSVCKNPFITSGHVAMEPGTNGPGAYNIQLVHELELGSKTRI